ncbi:outer membrane beta-barrel protein [Planctomicrobium sp. SH664]|uniref:outer membrane beta-barrel protein n=1 Tax=Planctomicrobium sp. SH664 TaxID=3448125 RepID=UPI003F5BA6CE
MRKLKTREWLLSLAVALGASSTAFAQENQFVSQAEAILGSSETSLIQQINHDAPVCDLSCDLGGCDAAGADPVYLFDVPKFDLSDSLLGEDAGWDLGGWFSAGFTTANDGVFWTYPHHLQLNQMNLYAEKVADGSNGVGFGGRVDLMYGTDAPNTQSFGNPAGTFDYLNGWDHGVYGWAMPQLYGEVAYGDLSVKVGHFYTLLGYQVVPATGNFFYSIPYTFNFSEAFTHTGALATYKANDKLTLYGGWTLGWDTGFEQLNGGSSFLGGASYAVTDDLAVTYICTFGNLGWIGEGYTHSIVADYVINDKWEYVFQSDVNSVGNSPNSIDNEHYDTVGVNQYLFYTFNDWAKAGARVEWWKADGDSLYEMAYGVNFMPIANLRIRPEVRYNWAPGGVPYVTSAVAPPSVYQNQFIFGMDAIYTF